MRGTEPGEETGRRGKLTLRYVLAVVAVLGITGAPALAQAPTPSPTPASDESVRGTITLDGAPVPGVDITVNRKARRVGTATTSETGAWAVPVPGPGEYTVTIDVDTLPDGVQLRFEDRQTLTVNVRPQQQRPVLFALVEAGAADDAEVRSTLERAIDLGVDGVKFGMIIALASMGLSLIYGVTKLVNFAQSELVTFGAVTAYVLNAGPNGRRLPVVVAAAVAVVLSGGLGWGLETGLFRPLRRRRTSLLSLMIISIGLALVLRHVILALFGPQSRPYTDYATQTQLMFGPISLVPKDLFIIVLAAFAISAVAFVLQRTRLGTAMRAVSDNRDLAESSGIDVNRVITHTWVLGAALAGLAGIFQGLTDAVSWNLGFGLLLLMFAAVVVGGLGTAYGPVLGGLLIGVVIQVSTLWFSVEFKLVIALLALIAAMLVRPQGLLGTRERIG
jgi:neutral amino acid transport system permease protein